MKIIMVHNYYQQRGGEDSVFENETELLRENGHKVETLVFHNEGIQGLSGKIQAGLSSIYNRKAVKLLKDKIDVFQPDIMHSHNFFPLASPAIFHYANQRNLPTVLTLHNYRLLCANALLYRDGQICEECLPQKNPLNGIIHACYRNSRTESAALSLMNIGHRWAGTWRNHVDQFITLTDFARQKFLESGLNLLPGHVSIKPNFLQDSGEGNLSERENYMVYVGRLSAEKGVNVLLEAFKKTTIPLKIIGTGPLEETVKQAVVEAPNIEALGFLSQEQIIDVIKKARGLIFPSTWYEGFPMTILEALSTGTPVLASAVGGLPEIILDGENGLHLLPGSAQSIVEQVNVISGDDGLHQRLCLNARDSYLSRYTPAININLLVEIYNRAQKRRYGNQTNSPF